MRILLASCWAESQNPLGLLVCRVDCLRRLGVSLLHDGGLLYQFPGMSLGLAHNIVRLGLSVRRMASLLLMIF